MRIINLKGLVSVLFLYETSISSVCFQYCFSIKTVLNQYQTSTKSVCRLYPVRKKVMKNEKVFLFVRARPPPCGAGDL